MPGTPKPVVDPRFGPAWTPIIQSAQAQKLQSAALNSGSQSTNIIDAYGNTVYILGQMNQIVTIGAAFQQPGVLVGTGLPIGGIDPRQYPPAGLISHNDTFWGTATTTSGSLTCSVVLNAGSNDPGGFTGVNVQIGAANVTDPSTGTATPAITPGTHVVTWSGTFPNYTVTLSQVAAETGSGLYFASCVWGRITVS